MCSGVCVWGLCAVVSVCVGGRGAVCSGVYGGDCVQWCVCVCVRGTCVAVWGDCV